MRLLGTIEGKTNAESLVAYLVTLDINTHVEPIEGRTDAWELWVRDENRLPEAIQEMEAFHRTPNDSKYSLAIRDAQEIVRQKQLKRVAAAKNIRKVRANGMPTMLSGPPPALTLTLSVICVIVSLVTNFDKQDERNPLGNTVRNQLDFVENQDYAQSGGVASASLSKWELWRVITPIFMHGDPLHLLVNVLMLFQLGRMCERMEGTVRFAVFVLLIAIASNLLQGLMPETGVPTFLRGNPKFVGISGVVFGLFGFIWVKTQLRPDLGLRLNEVSVMIMLGFLVAGFIGVLGPKPANLCHLGGLLSGMALGWLAANWNAPSGSKRPG